MQAESFDTIESFVMSVLATKDFPDKMSASALFNELHRLAILYSDHLNRPRKSTKTEYKSLTIFGKCIGYSLKSFFLSMFFFL